MKKTNYSYIGISFIILIFGIIFIPKIINRINNDEIVDEDRHNLERKSLQKQVELARIGNKTVPQFSFVNQEGDTITNTLAVDPQSKLATTWSSIKTRPWKQYFLD